jgi:homoserine dehydrogenase
MTHPGRFLRQAQELGYAEPDPTNDVEGFDSTYKLAILASLAFHTSVHPDQIHREGITALSGRDFRYAAELGYAIKLLALARKDKDGVEARVHPALVPREELLANVDGVVNAIQVEGDLVGRVLFQGPGAG